MFQIPSSPRVGRALRRASLATLACASAAAALTPASALAASPKTWYVSASATSNPTCQTASKTTPFQTIAAALACASSGNTVKVGAGTFAGGFTVPAGVLLEGAGANHTTISDAAKLSMPEVTVASGAETELESLAVEGGSARNAGIVAGSGSLELAKVTVSGTFGSSSAAPAAVSVIPGSGAAQLSVVDSTISDNFGFFSGAISAGTDTGGAVSVTVIDSTITGNQGGNEAGGIDVINGTLTARDDTISDNGGGNNAGGLWVGPDTTATLQDDLIAANQSDGASDTADCGASPVHGSVVDDGHNLIGVASPGASLDCGLTNGTNGDVTGSPSTPLDPRLGTLAANGGPTETQALLAGSPAIDAGDPAGCEASPESDLDQRGRSRAATARFACDIGAYDTAGKGGHVWPVSATAKSTPTCATASPTQPFPTIADALACAQDGDTVKLGPGRFGGGFTLSANVILRGSGASRTTISDKTAVSPAELTVGPAVSATIEGLTIRGGGSGDNGGILSQSGNLVIERTAVTAASPSSADPAPVAVDPSAGNATVTILDSTVSNSLGDFAGGVFVSTAFSSSGIPAAPPSHALIANSTISGNSGLAEAGGILISNTDLSLRDDTIADNQGNFAGGLFVATDADATVTDTLVATNTSQSGGDANDCQLQAGASLVDGGNNLVGIASPGTNRDCGFVGGTNRDLTGTPSAPLDPQLGPLAHNGGPTETQALEAGSPAIGAGFVPDCVAPPVSDLDQRGDSRAASTRGACDIGAYDTGGA